MEGKKRKSENIMMVPLSLCMSQGAKANLVVLSEEKVGARGRGIYWRNKVQDGGILGLGWGLAWNDHLSIAQGACEERGGTWVGMDAFRATDEVSV